MFWAEELEFDAGTSGRPPGTTALFWYQKTGQMEMMSEGADHGRAH